MSGRTVIRVDPDLRAFIPDYLARRREDVRTLARALERGDFEAIRVLGHQMKGSGAGYGFDALTDLGHGIEQAAKAADAAAIQRCAHELLAYLDGLVIV